MARKMKKRQSGTFTISPGRVVHGELTLAGPRTSLHLHDKAAFTAGRCVTGILHDLTRVTLVDCLTTSSSTVSRSDEDGYHCAEVFPHFVLLGDRHLIPEEDKVAAVDFTFDDATVLFPAGSVLGWLRHDDARTVMQQIANVEQPGRQITVGPDAQILYFTGKRDIFCVETAFGRVSATRNTGPIPTSSGGWAFRNRAFVSLDFHKPIAFSEAVSRAFWMMGYLGLLIGRPQNLVDLSIRVEPEHGQQVGLSVHCSNATKRDSSNETSKPRLFDGLLEPVRNPDEFSRVMARWLERHEHWRSARSRFLSSFAHQRSYSIDRLIGSANMFDILPDSAVPRDAQLAEQLKDAQSAGRKLFCDLPQSPERDSILGALGRIGKSNLKRKIRYRAQPIIDSCGERFPELVMVIDEAVNCRNYYVHGGKPRFDYDENFHAVTFFIDTLEFVFAASDLIEATWDIRGWIQKGTSMSHPFGAYWGNYFDRLNRLKALFPKSVTDGH